MVLFINPNQENQGTLLVCSFIGLNVQNYRKTHSFILEIKGNGSKPPRASPYLLPALK
jgi:hypothetical protein